MIFFITGEIKVTEIKLVLNIFEKLGFGFQRLTIDGFWECSNHNEYDDAFCLTILDTSILFKSNFTFDNLTELMKFCEELMLIIDDLEMKYIIEVENENHTFFKEFNN